MKKLLLGAVLALALIPAMPQTSEARMHGVDRVYYWSLVDFYTAPSAATFDALFVAYNDAMVFGDPAFTTFVGNNFLYADFLYATLAPAIITTAPIPTSPV